VIFADGHGWLWRFRDSRTPLVNAPGTDQMNNKDLATLADATTVAE
jgi:hypothetical protein